MAKIKSNQLGPFTEVAQKATPIAADRVLIEDSEAGGEKKYAQAGNLPGGGGGMTAHALGGAYHSADTLANLNSKLSGGKTLVAKEDANTWAAKQTFSPVASTEAIEATAPQVSGTSGLAAATFHGGDVAAGSGYGPGGAGTTNYGGYPSASNYRPGPGVVNYGGNPRVAGHGGHGATNFGAPGFGVAGYGGAGSLDFGGDNDDPNSLPGHGGEGQGGSGPSGPGGKGGDGYHGVGGSPTGNGLYGRGASSGYGVWAEIVPGGAKAPIFIGPSSGGGVDVGAFGFWASRLSVFKSSSGWNAVDLQPWQGMHKVTAGEVTAGYFTLSQQPVLDRVVTATVISGTTVGRRINADALDGTGLTADFEISGQLFIINNNGPTSFTLSDNIVENDVLIFEYLY